MLSPSPRPRADASCRVPLCIGEEATDSDGKREVVKWAVKKGAAVVRVVAAVLLTAATPAVLRRIRICAW